MALLQIALNRPLLVSAHGSTVLCGFPGFFSILGSFRFPPSYGAAEEVFFFDPCKPFKIFSKSGEPGYVLVLLTVERPKFCLDNFYTLFVHLTA